MASLAQATSLLAVPASSLRSVPAAPLSCSSARQSSRVGLRSFARRTSSACSSSLRSSPMVVRAGVTEITGAQFEEVVLKADMPVIVDFCAKWCGPCRLIAPVMDWAAKEYDGRLQVFKIDVDTCPKLVEQYKVYGLPTVIIFDQGGVAPNGHIEGALTSAKLKTYIAASLPTLA